MTTHFGRWLLIAGMLILVVACGLVGYAFGHTTVGRAFWLMSVVGCVARVFCMARLRGVRPSIITILATVAASGVTAWTFGWLDARWWEKFLLLALTTTPLSRMADAAYRSDIRRGQRRRNQLTADLVGRLRDGDEVEPCVLYLRPFAVTNRLPASYQSRLRRKAPVHLDLEILLERSLRNQRSFVALGRSAEMGEGAARVTTGDDDWRDIVQLLARQATFVAMVPLSRPGTMWELQWLAEQDLLGKTLFIMPETIDEIPSGVIYSVEKSDRIFDGDRRYDPAEHTLELPQEWFEAVRVARGFGLELPPLADVGALFTLDPETRKVAKIVPLALSSLTNWSR
jgi:hypothetical protein